MRVKRPLPWLTLLFAAVLGLGAVARALAERSAEETEREATRELFERFERDIKADKPPGIVLAECLSRAAGRRPAIAACVRAYRRHLCREPVTPERGLAEWPRSGAPPASPPGMPTVPEPQPGSGIGVAEELERREKLCPPTAEERRDARRRRAAAHEAGSEPSFALVRRLARPVLRRAGCKRARTVELDSSNLDPVRDALDTRSLECDGEVLTWERYATERARRADDPLVPPGPFFVNANVRVSFDEAGLPRLGSGGLERLPSALRRACGCGAVETEGRSPEPPPSER